MYKGWYCWVARCMESVLQRVWWTIATVPYAATPFILFCQLFCRHLLLWPTLSSEGSMLAFFWLAQVTGLAMRALAGLGKVSGLRQQALQRWNMSQDLCEWGREKSVKGQMEQQSYKLNEHANRQINLVEVRNGKVCKPPTWWQW